MKRRKLITVAVLALVALASCTMPPACPEPTPKATKSLCTSQTKAELGAHFKSKGWVHWQFACVGDSLHASYLAGLPSFNEAVLRGDVAYLQEFYPGEIYVTRHYEDRSLGVCRFANGEIYCDSTED